jgi:hypothetical protein
MGDLFSRLSPSDDPPASIPPTGPLEAEVTIAMEMHNEDVGVHAVKLSEIGSRQRPKTVLLEKRKIKITETGGAVSGRKLVEVAMPQSMAKRRGLV